MQLRWATDEDERRFMHDWLVYGQAMRQELASGLVVHVPPHLWADVLATPSEDAD